MTRYKLSIRMVCLALVGVVLAACSQNSYVNSGPVLGKQISYQNSSENFLNPERGFHLGGQLMSEDFSSTRSQGSSMRTAYVMIDGFRNAPLSQSFLDSLRSRFDKVRSAGIKVVPRFTYNFPLGDYCPAEDAPLSRVLEHINQLKPIFQEYSDVIMAVQAGFIGAWGEWHCSSNGLDNLDNKRKVLEALLAAVPKDRMVQIRYMDDMVALYPSPLSSEQAYSGSNQSRVAFHNDCFLANNSDAGTYKPYNQISAQKTYLDKLGNFIAVGGETCQVSPSEWRTQCPTTLREMSDQGWSFISGTWYKAIIDQWKSEGCYNEIARRLGYRFTLTKAIIPDEVSGRLRMSFDVKNEGFATPFNPRPVQIVLRNRATKAVYTMPASADPRRWNAGETTTVVVDVPLASGVGAGEYDVLLHLPDASAKIASRPEYAIRLANQGVWEASTGYNSLQHVVKVQ